MQRFAHKVAVVTASTDGIGFHIARRLAKEGAKVVVSSRRSENVEKAVEEIRKVRDLPTTTAVHGIVCHVAKSSDRTKLLKETVKTFGKIDVLVSNAAVNPVFGTMMETTTESVWDKIFEVNVKCAFLLAKESLPYLQKNANILFNSSITGFVPETAIGAYSVSKTSLLGLVKVLSQELGPTGIRVNGLAPGVIRTKFAGALVEIPELVDRVVSMTALKRLGEPEDCAGPAAFLCSDDAKFVTGEILCVTGGQVSRL